jgi:lysophospholipase L1-like esterase
MSARFTSLKIGCCIVVWSGVVLAATHQSHTPVVFGRYSGGYVLLLALLVGVALMLSLAKSAWYQHLYQARAGFIISGISLLLSLGALELVVRLIDPLGIFYYESMGNYTRDRLPDKQLVFRHKTSWATHYGDVLVTYNERGLRDRPIVPKGKNEYRVLALGDSVTFGWGVDQEKTFAARLESLLQGRLHRPVRVINSGVAGYNTVQEVTYFKQEGITLQPDLVLLTYVQNDTEELNPTWDSRTSGSLRGKSATDMVTRVAGKLWLYRLTSHTYKYGLKKRTLTTPSPEATGWHQSMAALRELVTICSERRISLMVFFERSQRTDSTLLFEDVVRNTRGVPVEDMALWYEGLDTRSFMNSKIDSHPNAEGHRLMAEHMANDIVSYLAMTSPTTILASHK